MEALLFVTDILCMVALVVSVARAARGTSNGLGIFQFKELRTDKVDSKSDNKGLPHA